MRKLLFLLGLVPALALGQGLSPVGPGQSSGGKTLLSLDLSTTGALISDTDYGTPVLHAYWNGTSVVTPQGTLTMQGTVSQTGSVPFTTATGRGGSGPYSAANYYSTTGIDLSASDMSVCAVYNRSAASQGILAAMDNAGTRQFILYAQAAGQASFLVFNGAQSNSTISGGASAALNGPRIVCASYQYVTNGTSVLRMVDDLATVTAVTNAVGPLPAGTQPLVVGNRLIANDGFAGTIYEVVVWKGTALTNAQMVAIQQRVLGHLYGSTALSVTRSTTATYEQNGAVWTVPAGVARVTSDGLLVESGRTNYALQSGTMSTGTSATSPWGLSGNTVTTVAGAPDGAGTWAEVTSTNASGELYQRASTASSASFAASAWVRSASGSGSATVMIYVNSGTVSSCACGSSDGSSCTTYTGSAGRCQGRFTSIGTTPIRAWVTATYQAADLAPYISLAPHIWQVDSSGTMRFSLAQLEVGTYPSSYIPTTTTAVTRAADQVSVSNPIPTGTANWCVATDAKPYGGRAWNASPGGVYWGIGNVAAANSAYAQYASDGLRYLEVFDASGAVKYVTASGAFSQGISYRMADCDASGVLSKLTNGAPATTTVYGAGSGIIGTMPATMYLGNGQGLYQFDGFIKNFKVTTAKSLKDAQKAAK